MAARPELAAVFGKPSEETPGAAEPGVEEMSPEFVEMATLAFPDLAEDPERLSALKEAIKACMEGDY